MTSGTLAQDNGTERTQSCDIMTFDRKSHFYSGPARVGVHATMHVHSSASIYASAGTAGEQKPIKHSPQNTVYQLAGAR